MKYEYLQEGGEWKYGLVGMDGRGEGRLGGVDDPVMVAVDLRGREALEMVLEGVITKERYRQINR